MFFMNGADEMKKMYLSSLSIMALAAILGCSGGGGGGGVATKLTYANPTNASSSDYRLLLKSGNSTGTITLALHGPASTMARGINYGISSDATKATFAASGGEFAEPGTVFDLGSDPQIFKSVLDGGAMRVTMVQKGTSVSAKSLDGEIATISLKIVFNTAKGKVALSGIDAVALLQNDTMSAPAAIKLGELTAE
jgi:hypothetical protein